MRNNFADSWTIVSSLLSTGSLRSHRGNIWLLMTYRLDGLQMNVHTADTLHTYILYIYTNRRKRPRSDLKKSELNYSHCMKKNTCCIWVKKNGIELV